LTIKSRTLAEKQRARAIGDYSVTVDRSGTSSVAPLPLGAATFGGLQDTTRSGLEVYEAEPLRTAKAPNSSLLLCRLCGSSPWGTTCICKKPRAWLQIVVALGASYLSNLISYHCNAIDFGCIFSSEALHMLTADARWWRLSSLKDLENNSPSQTRQIGGILNLCNAVLQRHMPRGLRITGIMAFASRPEAGFRSSFLLLKQNRCIISTKYHSFGLRNIRSSLKPLIG
jgi:hypothetical protein